MIWPEPDATNGCEMGWNQWYATRSYLRSTLWLVPLAALALEQVAIRIVTGIDHYFYWVPELATTVEPTIGELDTVISLTIAFIVFTFGSMLVALQVASGQLTPRIIATTLLQDNTIRFTVGLFVFILLFAAGTRAQTGVDIPRLAVTITVVLGIASVTSFLFLIDYTAAYFGQSPSCGASASLGSKSSNPSTLMRSRNHTFLLAPANGPTI
jgi:uncharacterized membrane protein